jgi:metal-responsive CopG/Arc/MetJ family transcriptional regulator
MKVAVSIPNELFEDAELLSKRLGISRSRLYATALEEIVAKNASRKITDQVNAACRELDTSLPEDIRRLRNRTLERAEW